MKDALSQLMWYIPALWRRRWQILGVAWLVCAAGWAAVAFIPDQYRVQSKVHIDTESLLRPLLRGLAVDVDPLQQIDLMQRTLVSRSNLERVARMTDLDLGTRSEEDMARLITTLQEKIALEADKMNIFTISYEDRDPQVAYKVVQALLSIYMESNAGTTRREFDSARAFLDDQVRRYERQMREAEARLNAFKQDNLGYLPGNTTFVDHMNRTRTDLDDLENQLAEAEARSEELRRQLADLPQWVEVANTAGPPTGLEVRILELQQRLDDMLMRYTPKHPDVVAVKALLESLHVEMAQAGGIPGGPPGVAGPPVVPAAMATGDVPPEVAEAAEEEVTVVDAAPLAANRLPNQIYHSVKVSLVDAESQVAALRSAVERKRGDLERLRGEVNRMPEIQAQLDRLNRDYSLARAGYEEFLKRRETANISESREVNADKVQFRVIDPPQVPVLPTGIKRPLLLSVVFVVGLAGALAIAVLLVSLQSNFVSTTRLSQIVGLPVLGSVSMVRHESAAQRMLRLSSFGGVASALIAVFVGLMVVELQVGLPNAVPADVKETVAGKMKTLVETIQ
ncbi:XrtA system polysaccharide chain length determinant [Caenispirillum bisanense]|uniref:Polysaccharide chain length determinant protein, PEP-CTERM locus subfamily n=1 Tax=Caenispirillum bisanense TaxID=414052 RepID=A0A286G5W5_9PROT|nr:XrtA system polysaccharide chain length determinant [Caenispirillum bisanense]SOD90872.1 polysaccharide chain length determinant protein, PEP-CTERM locus subfamily [Caenispirillum bisanense]